VTGPTGPFPGFTILGELGRGTTGIVYDAMDTRLNRRVALKVPVLAPEAERAVRCERFLREARALARLTGERQVGIPALLEVGEYQGQPFYIRELVAGDSLERLVAAGALGVRAGLAIVAAVARVIQWVHDRGFVHRNLSAANVLVGRDGNPWLIGFGRVGGTTPVPAEIDVRGLRDLIRWVCETRGQPVPTGLALATGPGPVASAAALGSAVDSYLRDNPTEPGALPGLC
jgi:serine/threonine protein kinase